MISRRQTPLGRAAPAARAPSQSQRRYLCLTRWLSSFRSPATVETLVAVAEVFRLSRDQARATLKTVAEATSEWRSVAEQHGLKREAINQMTPAFEHDQAVATRALSDA